MSPIIGVSVVDPDGKTEKLDFQEALEYCETEGELPMEALAAMFMTQDEDHSGIHGRVSPSMVWEETGCRRREFLKRFVKAYSDSLVQWEAFEGELLHNSFAKAGKHPAIEALGWEHEVKVPRDLLIRSFYSRGPDVVKRDPVDGKACVEVFPGVLMTGRIDKLNLDKEEIQDFKTTRSPYFFKGKKAPKDYGDKDAEGSWAVQLNLYRHMVQIATGKEINKIFVWRFYRGCKERSKIWRKFPIPLLTLDQIWDKCGSYISDLMANFKRGLDVWEEYPGVSDAEIRDEKLLQIGKEVRPDGLKDQKLHNTMCYKFCAMREVCFAMEGKTEF